MKSITKSMRLIACLMLTKGSISSLIEDPNSNTLSWPALVCCHLQWGMLPLSLKWLNRRSWSSVRHEEMLSLRLSYERLRAWGPSGVTERPRLEESSGGHPQGGWTRWPLEAPSKHSHWKTKTLKLLPVHVNILKQIRFFFYQTAAKGEPDLWKIQTHSYCFNAHLLICICMLIWSLKEPQWK